MKQVALVLFLLTSTYITGQKQSLPDSLRNCMKLASHDSVRSHLLKALFYYYTGPNEKLAVTKERLLLLDKNINSLPDESVEKRIFLKHKAGALSQMGMLQKESGDFNNALISYSTSLTIYESLGNQMGMEIGNDDMASVYKYVGNVKKAMEHIEKSLIISKEINDLYGESIAWNHLAEMYNHKGDIPKTLECLNKSLRLREKMDDKEGVASCLNNIGVVYYDQKDIKKAREYYLKSNDIYKAIGNKGGMANCIFNIAVASEQLGEREMALNYCEQGLSTFKEVGDKLGVAWALNQLGSMYKRSGNKIKALEYYTEALKIRQEAGALREVAVSLDHLGKYYLDEKNYKVAARYSEQSMTTIKDLGYPAEILEAAKTLWLSYKGMGKHKKALENYELYVKMLDSISNETTRKASIKSQLKYEYEKQAAADSVVHAKQSEIKNAEIAKQTAEIKAKKNQQYALFGGLALVIVFAGFMYNRFKITQKQKGIIEEQKNVVEGQKHLVEEKQKEILDSIHYAKRIQKAHLPSEKYLEKNIGRLKKE